MKINTLAFALILVSFMSCEKPGEFTVDCLSTNLQDGVLAFYPFNDGSLIDESPNNIDLTNSTSAVVAEDRFGNPQCAYRFQNMQQSDEFLTSTNSSFFDNIDEFSISVWYNIEDKINYGTLKGIVSRGTDPKFPGKVGELSVATYDCNQPVFGHNNSAWYTPAINVTDCNDLMDVLSDKWIHVVGIKNNDQYKIYFNGNHAETVTGDANSPKFESVKNVGDLFIGYNFTGRIDDVIIYDRELSAAEVNELYDLESCCM